MSQQIVHNTGINYTLYYNILNYFRTILKNHPSIGVATYGDLTDFDTKEFPAYPVGNVLITNSEFGTNVTTYTVQLTVADKIKNKNNESSGSLNQQSIDYFKGVDDTIDIHNNTLGILNDLTSYTQRGVAGFEIDGEIGCVPFSDRFNNGLAGWVATFSLTTHNDKNRCLFFLVNPSGSGYVIEECETGDRYKAVLNQSGSIGQVFSSKYTLNSNDGTTSYDNLKCYTIIEQINDTDDWDFVNLKVLALPFENYVSCSICELWINPKIWSTTPENWSSGSSVSFRTWAGD
jgi:hypothetical protein